jgi:sulfur carrier protein
VTLNHEPAICLNGVTRTLKAGETVTDVLIELTGSRIEADGRSADGRRLGVAVALNGAVISRSLWAQTLLTTGDDIEVVTAAQGG